ncbi:MAG TPA: RsmD family RNA methyltransferase [Thermoanaerobaculia bacterium]|nr:RsmD family RNA methyltransferase [Thermoanaerobaculia bacterium]
MQRGSEEDRKSADDRERLSDRQRHAAAVLARVDSAELRIEKLVQGGDGLARLEGVPILVARTAPGDLVRIRISERRVGWARAEVDELLESGPGRRPPPCPVFDRCGGCDLQHIEDSLQGPLKAAAARETLERLGGLRLATEPVLLTGEPWGYRLRAQWRVAGEGPTVRAGYFARRSHDLIPTTVCPILDPRLERELASLPDRLRNVAEPPRRLDVAVGDDGPSYAPLVEGFPHGALDLAVGELGFQFDSRTFFQAHRGLLPRLVEEVAGSHRGELAWDLYAGVGLFALALRARYTRVTAVESDRIAVRYLRRNARDQEAPEPIEIHNISAESFLQHAATRPDRVVVDPPRTGLSRSVVQSLLTLRPERLTYVSCDPATLARDLRALIPTYEPERLVFLDLFPQTAHLETVVHLAQRS